MTAAVRSARPTRKSTVGGTGYLQREEANMIPRKNLCVQIEIINAQRLSFLLGSGIFAAGTLIMFSDFVGKLV